EISLGQRFTERAQIVRVVRNRALHVENGEIDGCRIGRLAGADIYTAAATARGECAHAQGNEAHTREVAHGSALDLHLRTLPLQAPAQASGTRACNVIKPSRKRVRQSAEAITPPESGSRFSG